MAETEIIYGKMVEKNEPLFGKFIHPIKGFIQEESNLCEKNKSILKVLFNIEKSNRYAETIMAESDFDTFMTKAEGAKANRDTVEKTYHKTIEHISFGKTFVITREMADDAKFGIGANMSNRPRKFVRAYYKTKIKLGAEALINGTAEEMTFNGSTVDLTVGDGLPLFSGVHTYASEKLDGQLQSNYFYGDICSSEQKLEVALNILANKLRNFKDENGDTMGYVADILIIPCNRPELEMMAKKICGSERTTGSSNNDINTQYGNWTLVVLDGWETEDDRLMVMSSEANKNLLGNMFYNRVKLDITSKIDEETRNLLVNGYCRFGVGFTTWKHIALAVDAASAPAGSTATAV